MSPWLPYTPGSRTFPELPRELELQLRAIAPSHDGQIEYRPCMATLRDGRVLERVYVVDAQSYISTWGVWPEDDSGKHALDIAEVIRLEESPHRLPPDIADRIYRAGESGMGYAIFTIVFRDGTKQAYVSGNAVDFISYPSGQSAGSIAQVLLHQGRADTALTDHSPYCWCLFGTGSSKHSSKRWAG
jgi:hypothetical protein